MNLIQADVKRLREQYGLSRAELAHESGVNVETIRKIEIDKNHKTWSSTMKKLEKVLVPKKTVKRSPGHAKRVAPRPVGKTIKTRVNAKRVQPLVTNVLIENAKVAKTALDGFLEIKIPLGSIEQIPAGHIETYRAASVRFGLLIEELEGK